MPVKRQLRKIRRQARNGCIPHPVRFTRWNWFDWIAFIFACCFAIYAVVSIALHAKRIHDNYSKPAVSPKHPHEIDIEVQINNAVQPGRSICIGFIVVDILCIMSMILVFVWLRFLRNMFFFLLIFAFMIIVLLLYLILGASAASQRTNADGYLKEVHSYVTHHLTPELHADAGYFYFRLDYLQSKLNCCGIIDQFDWRAWNGLTVVRAGDYSVPNSCCVNPNDAMYFACENEEILKLKPNSAKYDVIHKNKGCGKILKSTIDDIYTLFMLEAFLLVLFLLIFLIVLLYMAHLLYKKMAKPNWELEYDPREQEDDLESEIIPGTPAKSMMSTGENTFYAP